ncbi:hypothetical protein [Serratia marcescens]|uniref:hypothetical protein n=1 Tax=Serratia marcescens TaxID=615 RepID=UPI0002B86D5A|nr:hypothetical protein [Serratia marcescens]EMF04244.1 hypothetical protein F518_18428 [Serratia marcescens VGH107]
MITFKPLCWFVLLMVLALPFDLFANSIPLPTADSPLGVEQFNIDSTDVISREVMVGKIMALISRDFNGEIRLTWTNDRFAESTKLLRNALIEQGVAPHRILLDRDAGGYRAHGSSGIQITVQRVILRLPECDDKNLNYHFDTHAILGCAVNNIRSISLVSPFKYYF